MTDTKTICGRSPGMRHVAVLLEVVAAIDQGRVVQLLGDVLEPGQEDDRVVAEARPDRQQHRDRQDEGRRGQPLDGFRDPAERQQHAVDEPVPLEQPAPRQADGDAAADRGHEVERPVDVDAAQLAVDHDGQRDRQDDQDRRDQQVDDRMGQRQPERRVREQVLVVLEADPDGRPDDVVVGEAVVDDRDDRVDHEDAQQHQRRGEEQVRRGSELAGHRPLSSEGAGPFLRGTGTGRRRNGPGGWPALVAVGLGEPRPTG